MRVRAISAFLVLCAAPLLAQAPAPAPAAQPHASNIGFTYSLPSDWEAVDTQPSLPVVKEQQTQAATSEEEKKGIACVQIALTARHGNPASVVVIVALPFDCFGQTMTDKELPGFATGASEGLKKSFEITNPVYDAYTLGSHSMWIERSTGSVIGHPDVRYTIETVCTILKKGAVCWMAMAADDAHLQTFEHGAVTLDSDAPVALVPASVFAKKPQP
jgi:hypothetical protein